MHFKLKDPKRKFDHEHIIHPARTYNQNHVPRKYTRGQAPLQHLLDLELPVGSQSGCDRNGQSLLDHDRGPQRGLAEL